MQAVPLGDKIRLERKQGTELLGGRSKGLLPLHLLGQTSLLQRKLPLLHVTPPRGGTGLLFDEGGTLGVAYGA